MLVANLPNELSIEIPKNLIDKEIRIVDCFHVQSHGYTIGAKMASFQVIFLKKIVEVDDRPTQPQNEESTEPKTRTRYDRREVFVVELNEEELSTWGTNDETLLNTIAAKLGVQIESFTYVSQEDLV